MISHAEALLLCTNVTSSTVTEGAALVVEALIGPVSWTRTQRLSSTVGLFLFYFSLTFVKLRFAQKACLVTFRNTSWFSHQSKSANPVVDLQVCQCYICAGKNKQRFNVN